MKGKKPQRLSNAHAHFIQTSEGRSKFPEDVIRIAIPLLRCLDEVLLGHVLELIDLLE